MKPYVHGQSAGAKLTAATVRINYLEHELARLRAVRAATKAELTEFSSPAFLAEYQRERQWAANRWPETLDVKQARLDAITNELNRRTYRRLAA